MILPLTLISCLTLAPLSAGPDWTHWRGPDGTGYVADANPPVTWSETSNIRWKVEIPGAGHASPIVLGDVIYMMSAVKTDRVAGDANLPQPEEEPGRGRGRGRRIQAPSNVYEFVVLALDRHDGEIMWTTTVTEAVPHEGMHPTATYASISPLTDGTHLYAHFGSRGLYCLDLKGNVVWDTDLGDMQTRMSFGEGASPALHGNTLVVPWDHEGDSFVVALNKKTGEELWRSGRDEHTNWSTPVIVEVDGITQAMVAGDEFCISYNVADGSEVWRCAGLGMNVVPTPILAFGNVYFMSGFRGSSLLAIKLAGARGDITDSDHVIWSHNRGTPYVPSGMLAGRNLYFLGSNNGILSCFDAVTGEQHYAGERLDGAVNVYSSIVGAGGHVYVCGREGDVAVMKDGPTFQQIATNTISEGINATPAIVGDTIYLRGDKHLYCIQSNQQ